MAVITSYDTLKTAIGDYLARDDLTTFVPNFIQNWEERFFRQPKNWGNWMEAALSVTMSSGVATVPSDYLGLRAVYISGSPATPLEQCGVSQLLSKYPRSAATGKPVYIARDRTRFIFGPEPDSEYTIAGTYYAKPTLLRDDGDGINWLVTNCPDLILYGALLEAEPFLKNDGRIAVWRDFYTDALADYRDMVSDTQHMGHPLAAVLG